MGYLASCSDEHIRKDIVRKVGVRGDRGRGWHARARYYGTKPAPWLQCKTREAAAAAFVAVFLGPAPATSCKWRCYLAKARQGQRGTACAKRGVRSAGPAAMKRSDTLLLPRTPP